MTDQTLVCLGGDVKALDTNKVGGYLIRFGGPDAPDRQGDYFSRETYIGRAVKAGTDVLYHHGLGKVDAIATKIGNRIIGDGSLTLKDEGWWIEATLDDSDPDVKAVLDLANAGKLAWSSGSTERLVKRRDVKANVREVVSWPLCEASLSPRAVDPRNRAICIKALADEAGESAETPNDDVKGALDGYPTTSAVGAALTQLHTYMVGRLEGCMTKRHPKTKDGLPGPAYGVMSAEFALAPKSDRLRESMELLDDYRTKAAKLVGAMLDDDDAAIKAILNGGEWRRPSLVDRAETLASDVEAVAGLFRTLAEGRRAEGRDLSAEKRQAIKALADSLEALYRQSAPPPSPERLRALRVKLLQARI